MYSMPWKQTCFLVNTIESMALGLFFCRIIWTISVSFLWFCREHTFREIHERYRHYQKFYGKNHSYISLAMMEKLSFNPKRNLGDSSQVLVKDGRNKISLSKVIMELNPWMSERKYRTMGSLEKQGKKWLTHTIFFFL